MTKTITGAVDIGGTVYRAGQEAEMEAAARTAGIDLSGEQFAGALAGYDAKADAKADARAKAETEPKATAKTDAKTDAKADTKAKK